jgi:hypothetical protein
MRALPNLRTSAIAIVAILAMLIVPACGSLCAAMNHCSSSADSAEPDACHHANMSAQPDSEGLSSPASCSQPAPLLAILATSDSSVQLKSVSAPNASFAANVADHSFVASKQLHELRYLKPPQQSTPLETLSILRI